MSWTYSTRTCRRWSQHYWQRCICRNNYSSALEVLVKSRSSPTFKSGRIVFVELPSIPGVVQSDQRAADRGRYTGRGRDGPKQGRAGGVPPVTTGGLTPPARPWGAHATPLALGGSTGGFTPPARPWGAQYMF